MSEVTNIGAIKEIAPDSGKLCVARKLGELYSLAVSARYFADSERSGPEDFPCSFRMLAKSHVPKSFIEAIESCHLEDAF